MTDPERVLLNWVELLTRHAYKNTPEDVERVREAGGRVLAQDEDSSVVWGMPGYVARAGLADAVLPPEALAAEVARRLCVGRPLSLQG